MSEYLSKEEIKQWRSSLEKITLEEFAARLGKKIEEAKPTNDLVDIVLKGQPVVSTADDWMPSKAERLSTIADRAFEREREIAPSPFSISNLKVDIDEEVKSKVEKKTSKKTKTVQKTAIKEKTTKPAKAAKSTAKPPVKTKAAKDLREEVRVVFKKLASQSVAACTTLRITPMFSCTPFSFGSSSTNTSSPRCASVFKTFSFGIKIISFANVFI